MSQAPPPDPSQPDIGAPGSPPGWGPAAPEQRGGSAGWAYPQQPTAPGAYAGLPAYPGQQPYLGPAVPPGYPPGYPSRAAPWPPPGYDPTDPLVTLPGEGLSGWFSRCAGALRRGWRVLVPVLALAHALPTLVLMLVIVPLYPVPSLEPAVPGGPPPPLPDGYLADLGVFFTALLGFGCLLGFVQAVGWAAGTWVVTRQAAGEPVSVGAALAYGLRRAPAVWGWTLLYGLLVLLGLLFCYLPGLYVMAALSLFGPVLLFERGAPLGRARQLFHARLGPVLGRITLVALVASLISLVVAPVQVAAGLVADPADTASLDAWNIAYAVGAALVAVPSGLAYLIGLVVTYAEQRAYEGPVTAARLAGELG
ncbi:hypothetical protein C5N14_00920 [Micromonospora sp. MW-13]|uniref:hypothetical protein n=1 Tax=Micromonospora sp. MW-13 TaxID=2094022 RepID=UPI000E437607|nr:hypothetical protein [Micromonospora sp. MW-13]RGC71050.1 hypothetical protein C5N14_00920 [Micromonospora sp. MW-13]